MQIILKWGAGPRPVSSDGAELNNQIVDNPLFSLGFRPFFLLAGLAALAPVAIWMLLFAGMSLPEGHYGIRLWHAHELLFGYAVAVMAGFLLTAIRNWTGQPTASGTALAGLALIWLAGRIVSFPFLNDVLPPLFIALVDVAFLPAFAWAAAKPMLAGGNHRNLIFPGMLLLLASVNVVVHGALLGALPLLIAERALEVAALIAILMITVMAGRVFPFFTERGIAAEKGSVPFKATIRPRIEQLAAPSVILFAVSVVIRDVVPLLPFAAAFAAVVQGVRLAGWYTPQIWGVPLLWVLQVGYAWMVLGYALFVAVGAGWLPFAFAMHALTAGAIGTITLGMMSRVALGHTGRALKPSPMIVAAFVLLTISVVLRVAVAALWPDQFALLVQLAGMAWTAAFVLFVIVYTPILVRPRVDGPPG